MRRLARVVVFAAVLLLVAVAGTVAWLAYSPSAARWLVQELIVRFEGQLSVGGVEGTLADGISLRDVTYRHGELRIEIDRAQAAWYWSALLDYRAQFRKLALGRVSVLLAPSSERAQSPETLAIPFTISVDDGRIDRLVVSTGAQELGIADIVFRGSAGPSQHILDALELRSTQGRVTGRAQIGTTKPFVLQAQMSFTPQAVDSLPSADLKLSGNLGDVSAQFSAQASWMAASGSAMLSPFEPVLVKKLYANAERIVVHERFPDTVNAELRGTLDLRQVAQDRFEGELQVVNADPGELGQSKLPIAGLAARLSGNADGIEIAGLELRMAKGAPLVGEGRLDAKALDLKLDTRALDLKAWDQRMVATKLAGSLRILAGREEQSLTALLTQADYRIELDVLKQGDALVIRRAAAAARGGSLTLAGHVSLQSRHAFDARGRLQRFDPSAFFEAPRARIDAELSAKGSLAPELNARIEMRGKGQGPRGEAFSADAQAVVSKRRVSDLRAKLTVGRNELNVSGAIGAPSDTLAFEARLPALSDLDGRYSGAIEGKGQLTGDLMHPAISLDANATRLAVPGGLSFGAMRVRAMLPADWNKPLDVEALAQEVRIDTTRVDKAAVVVRVDGIVPGSQAMHVGPRHLTGDGDRRSIGGRDAAVTRPRHLQRDERPAALLPAQEDVIQLARRSGTTAYLDPDIVRAQRFDPASGDPGVRILDRDHDAGNASGQDRRCTGRRSALVRAGFQVHVQREVRPWSRAGRNDSTGEFDRERLARRSRTRMEGFAHDRFTCHHDGSHHRIGRSTAVGTHCQCERPVHPHRILFVVFHSTSDVT